MCCTSASVSTHRSLYSSLVEFEHSGRQEIIIIWFNINYLREKKIGRRFGLTIVYISPVYEAQNCTVLMTTSIYHVLAFINIEYYILYHDHMLFLI